MLKFLGNFTQSCEVGTMCLWTKHNNMFFFVFFSWVISKLCALFILFGLVQWPSKLKSVWAPVYSFSRHTEVSYTKMVQFTVLAVECWYSCRLWFLKCLSHGWTLPATIRSFHGVWCAICSKEPSGVHMHMSSIWKQF